MSDLSKIEYVPFHGDEIEVIRGANGRRYVVPKRICENLGVDWGTQYRKLQSARWACVVIMTTHDTTGREQETVVIPLKAVPMWMAGIKANKVHPAIRERLEIYQDEAAEVLARYFTPEDEPTSSTNPAILAALTTIMTQVQGQQVQMMTMLQGQQVQLERLRADMDRWGELNRHQLGSQANPYRTIPPGYETHERFIRQHNLTVNSQIRKRELPFLKRLPGVSPLYYRLDDAGFLYRLFPMAALVVWFNDFLKRHPDARDGYLPGIDPISA